MGLGRGCIEHVRIVMPCKDFFNHGNYPGSALITITALANPEVKAAFLKLGLEPEGGGSDILAAKVQSEMSKWQKLVREKNIRIEQ